MVRRDPPAPLRAEIMTVKQVADYLQMESHTVYKMARLGEIPSFKVSGRWRFKRDLIDEWFREKSLGRVRKEAS
ncbi:MAG: helix-turn-helix domain-containing protein [Nitrospirae bacterium]|nr:helix-turn-helix domain-containing protein [Nitrospirota bacterium]